MQSFSICRKDGSDLDFNQGQLECSAYSYMISSFGYVELSKKETYELFLAMQEYYKENPYKGN